jgi:peptidoglycan/LPS O-acetylase OafA/YrhL
MFHADRTRYRADIDGLRAIAVVSVLLFHLDLAVTPGGFAGVDIFFVISGFLITGLIHGEIEETGTFRFGAFYLRRIRRLFPALFATLLMTALAAAFLLSPAHLQGFGSSLAAALGSVSNIFFWAEADYFDQSARAKPLLHTWSLSVEEQFYLLWPLLLLGLQKGRWARRAPAVIAFLGLLSLAANFPVGKGAGGDWNEDGHASIFYLLPFRAFEFAIGGLMVWTTAKRISWPARDNLLFVSGLALIAYAVLTFHSEMLFPSWRALVPCTGAALIIYAGDRASFAAILRLKPVVWIGLISYSLYLVHWPLIVFWQYVGGDLGLGDRVAIVVISLLLGWASYRGIEQPFRTRKFEIARPAWRHAAIAGCLAITALGLHMRLHDGWAWRAPPSPVKFDYVGDAANFHRTFYGGSGYPSYGPVQTDRKPDIVLVGDSHGKHYAEGLWQVVAKRHDLALYVSAGTSCFHLPGFTRITPGQDWDRACRDALERALSYIDTGKTPIVVVSHSWLSQASRGALLDSHGKRTGVAVDAGDIVAGILALKSRIGNSPLVVIGEVPRSGENLYDVLTRPRPPFMPAADPLRYLVTRADPERRKFNSQLRNAADRTGRFIFLDPYDLLCDRDACRNTSRDNHLVYSDNGHLSKYGSVELIEGFLPALHNANRGRQNSSGEVRRVSAGREGTPSR